MSPNSKVLLVTACMAVMTAGARSAERGLIYTPFDVPGSSLTNAQGINAGGEIVGLYNHSGSPSRTHGFVWSGGVFQSVDVPGAKATNARGIGPGGDIVGTYQLPSETGGVPSHGFRLSNQGVFSAADYPGHLNTIPQRILPDGTILGCYHDNDLMGSMHGMMMSRAGNEELAGGMSMNNGATPNRKLIVGLFTDMDNKPKGYLIDRGNFQAFEVPGALSTAGWDINPAGVRSASSVTEQGSTASGMTARTSGAWTFQEPRLRACSESMPPAIWWGPTGTARRAPTGSSRSGRRFSSRGSLERSRVRPQRGRATVPSTDRPSSAPPSPSCRSRRWDPSPSGSGCRPASRRSLLT